MTWNGSPARVRPVNRQLWKKFVRIAQPYFYPLVRGGGCVTLLLMLMLLVWVFAVLGLGVGALTLAGHHLDPTLTETIAPGLAGLLSDLVHVPGVLLVITSLVLPLGCFLAVGRQLRARWQPWVLLAIVLFLSLAVTGLNVGFSYIG